MDERDAPSLDDVLRRTRAARSFRLAYGVTRGSITLASSQVMGAGVADLVEDCCRVVQGPLPDRDAGTSGRRGKRSWKVIKGLAGRLAGGPQEVRYDAEGGASVRRSGDEAWTLMPSPPAGERGRPLPNDPLWPLRMLETAPHRVTGVEQDAAGVRLELEFEPLTVDRVLPSVVAQELKSLGDDFRMPMRIEIGADGLIRSLALSRWKADADGDRAWSVLVLSDPGVELEDSSAWSAWEAERKGAAGR